MPSSSTHRSLLLAIVSCGCLSEPLDSDQRAREPLGRCDGDPDLIDDLEDHDGILRECPEDAPRLGTWYTYNDGMGKWQHPNAGAPFIPRMGGASNSLWSARTDGDGFIEWGAGMGFDLNNPGCSEIGDGCKGNEMREPYDVSEWWGIQFFARSNDKTTLDLHFKALTMDRVPVEDGGTCVEHCNEFFVNVKVPSGDWASVECGFEEFRDIHSDFHLDPTQVVGFQWHVAHGEPFDFSIDDVRFVSEETLEFGCDDP